MKRKFRSDAAVAVHDHMEGLQRAGLVDKTTMAQFNESCLAAPTALKPEAIKKLRKKNHVSQPVFARYLSTSESTVQKWETGAKKPSGMALKLLSLVQKHGLEILG